MVRLCHSLPCPLSTEPSGREERPTRRRLWFLPWEWPVPIGSLGKACSHLEKRWPRWALAQQVLKGREVMAESDLGNHLVQLGFYTDRETEARRGNNWSQRELGQGLDDSPGL